MSRRSRRSRPKKITFHTSVSFSFPARARCKYCFSPPVKYYRMAKTANHLDPNIIINFYCRAKKYIKRMAYDYYLFDKPRGRNDVNHLVHRVFYKGYTPAKHHKGEAASKGIVDMFSCECGKTNWGFTQESAAYSPEVDHRQARTKYSQGADDWV